MIDAFTYTDKDGAEIDGERWGFRSGETHVASLLAPELVGLTAHAARDLAAWLLEAANNLENRP